MLVPERSPREMKGRGFGLDRLQRRQNVFALDPGGIVLGAHQDEVIIHHGITLHPEAFGQKLFLGGFGMNEDDIGVAAPCGVERLTGALGQHFHLDAGLLLHDRQQVAEQT